MLATYHNHSTWSDGKATIGEHVKAARELGIGELGISDHFALHPSGRDPAWAIPRHQLNDYVDDVLRQRDEAASAGGPVVRLGLEVDWFAGNGDVIRKAIADHPWDFLIGSVHFVDGFTVDGSPAGWRKLSEESREEVHRTYWANIKSMAESGLFDIVAHLDIVKKFGFRAENDISLIIHEALDAIAAAGMVVEINTAGWHKPCRDAYPSLEILRACREREIAVTISADGHLANHLLRGFRRAADRLAEAGYERVARFAGRQVRFEPLADAVAGLPDGDEELQLDAF